MSDRPDLLVEIKIEPKSVVDTERLMSALARMASDNGAFGYSRNAKTGEVIVMGVDERALDAQIGALRSVHAIDILVGPPQVRYRETLACAVNIDYTHKKLMAGGTSQFARIKLRLEPNVDGTGNELKIEIVGDVLPKKFIPAIAKGVHSVWDAGVLIGFPMVDTTVTLYDGAYHELDSSADAFESAARMAMREGLEKAGVKLLEPIMDVEVSAPGDLIGSVIGDINRRRGLVIGQEARDDDHVIRAQVPLAELFGYQSDLRSIANGLARCAICFSHYAEVPPGKNGPYNFPPAVGMRA